MLQFFQTNVPQGMDKNSLEYFMKRRINSSDTILLNGATTWPDKQQIHLDELTYPMRKTTPGIRFRKAPPKMASHRHPYIVGNAEAFQFFYMILTKVNM